MVLGTLRGGRAVVSGYGTLVTSTAVETVPENGEFAYERDTAVTPPEPPVAQWPAATAAYHAAGWRGDTAEAVITALDVDISNTDEAALLGYGELLENRTMADENDTATGKPVDGCAREVDGEELDYYDDHVRPDIYDQLGCWDGEVGYADGDDKFVGYASYASAHTINDGSDTWTRRLRKNIVAHSYKRGTGTLVKYDPDNQVDQADCTTYTVGGSAMFGPFGINVSQAGTRCAEFINPVRDGVKVFGAHWLGDRGEEQMQTVAGGTVVRASPDLSSGFTQHMKVVVEYRCRVTPCFVGPPDAGDILA